MVMKELFSPQIRLFFSVLRGFKSEALKVYEEVGEQQPPDPIPPGWQYCQNWSNCDPE